MKVSYGAVGSFVAMTAAAVAPTMIHPMPMLTLVATVTAIQLADRSSGPAAPATVNNLNILARCIIESPSHLCAPSADRLHFPGSGHPDVKPPPGGALTGPVVLPGDRWGRTTYEVKIDQPLAGGQGFQVNVPIIGKVEKDDLVLLTLMGDDLIKTKFDCTESPTGPGEVSKLVCSERIGTRERLAALIPFLH
jgi:hypothetical protein